MYAGSEVHCTDGSCSIDGACSSGYRGRMVALNAAPILQLLPVFAVDSSGIVQVPRGWLYDFCEPGNSGTALEPCEPGARFLFVCISELPHSLE